MNLDNILKEIEGELVAMGDKVIKSLPNNRSNGNSISDLASNLRNKANRIKLFTESFNEKSTILINAKMQEYNLTKDRELEVNDGLKQVAKSVLKDYLGKIL